MVHQLPWSHEPLRKMTNVIQFTRGRAPTQSSKLAGQAGTIEERAIRDLACVTFVLETTASRLQQTNQPLECGVQTRIEAGLTELRRLLEILQCQTRLLNASNGRQQATRSPAIEKDATVETNSHRVLSHSIWTRDT